MEGKLYMQSCRQLGHGCNPFLFVPAKILQWSTFQEIKCVASMFSFDNKALLLVLLLE